MSVLNKPYEISIWGDTWDSTQNKFIEEKLLIIGSNTMTSQSRVLLPKLVENVNGTHTLTFTIYYRYKDNIAGQTVDNPYVPYLTNERKLKLRYGDVNNADYEWYDFVIKNIKVDTVKHAYEITATDQYVNELSKNGFNFTFDSEITNPSNVGTVQELASRALEYTDWNVIDRSTSAPIVSEFIPDLAKETLVKLLTNNSLTAIKINDSTEGLAPTFIQNQSIPSGSVIYAFYSCLADQAQRFQFIYKAPAQGTTEPVFEKDSERVITEKSCQYYIDDLGYGSLNVSYGIYTPNSCSIQSISTDYRGARYVFSPDTRYNSVIDRYVTIYNKDDEQYYGYTKSETIVPNIIQNWVTNPNTFKSTNGWHVGTIDSGSTTVGTLQNEAINNITGHTLLEDLRTNSLANTYHAILSYTPVTPATSASNHIIVNTGFYDNRYSINNLKNGQKFVCRIKATGTVSNKVAIKLGTVNQKYYEFSSTLAESNFVDSDDGYKTAILTIDNSEFTPTTYKKQNVNRVYIVLSGTAAIKIEDFQIFEYVPKGITFLKPEDQLVNAVTTTTYILYSKSQIDDLGIGQTLDDINPIYEGTVLPTELNPAYTIELRCEKRRAITAKESNYFNIIQTLCETFECWAKFNITHDTNGQITGKSIEFHNYVGQINYAGFRYGVNLKSIMRTDDSKSIVTKLIVKQNSNEFGQNGFCTIARAPSNETGEINIYNLDHYINQGLLSASDWNNAIYNTEDERGKDIDSNDQVTNSNGYYVRLRNLNNQINSKNDILLQKARSFAQAQADVQLYEDGLTTALDEFQDATDSFYKLTGYEYNNAGADEYNISSIYNIGDRVVHENQIYQCTVNGTTGSWDASKWIFDIVETKIDYLVKCAEAYQAKEDYAIKVNNAKTYYINLETEYNSLNDDINILISQKKLLNKAFYEKFYRFIQEGTWISEEYYDDEKYYLDALSTLYNSSVPKVSYNIAVLELSQLTGYEDFKFNIGDRTYIEDTEFFGYDDNGNPVREEVILSEITYNLDEPDKNTIKIQNFKTQFQDLFKRITATVQQVQFSTGAYDQAAELARANDQDKSKYLQGALNDASMILQNLAEQTVKLDSTGLTITDKLEPNHILRAVSGGILLTKDGGNTWSLGITAKGVNASIITSGILDTSEINIMNGNESTFRWDVFGLTAYNFDTNGQIISNISQSGGVRFDRLGIYGFAGAPGDWHPSKVAAWTVTEQHTISPTSDNTYVRAHSIFELTRRGLYLNLGKGDNRYYHYYRYNSSNPSDNGYYSFSSSSYLTHVTHAELGKIWDVVYNNWTSTGVPYYSSADSSYGTFSKVFVAGRGDTVSESFALFDDGVIKAKKIYVEDGIGFNDGSGLVHAVYHKYFSGGPQKPTDGTPYSEFPDHEKSDYNGWHKIRSSDDYYTSVSYDNGNHWDVPTGVLGEVWYLTLPRGNSLSQSSDGGWPTQNVIESNAFQVTAHKRENGTEGNQSVYWKLTTTNNSSSAISVNCGTTSADTIYISTTSVNGVWCWRYKVGSTGSITTASTLHVTTSPLVVGAYLDSSRNNGFASENIVCTIKGNNGQDGAPGAPGQDGDSTYIQDIYYVTNNWDTVEAIISDSPSLEPATRAAFKTYVISSTTGNYWNIKGQNNESYYTATSTYPYAIWCQQTYTIEDNNKILQSYTTPTLLEAWLNNSALNSTTAGRERYATLLRLTNGGTNQGIYYTNGTSNGDLYINASCIKTGEFLVSDNNEAIFSASVSNSAVQIANFKVKYGGIYTSDSSGNLEVEKWNHVVTLSGIPTAICNWKPKEGTVFLGNKDITNFTSGAPSNPSSGYTAANSFTIGAYTGSLLRLVIGPNFGVTSNGDVYCSNVYLTGGKIGNWEISSQVDLKGNGTYPIYLMPNGNGSVTSSSNLYKITGAISSTSDNALSIRIGERTNATFGISKKGDLYATAGKIGKWEIKNNKDLVGNDNIYLIPDGDGVVRACAPLARAINQYNSSDTTTKVITDLSIRVGGQTDAVFGVGANGDLYAVGAHFGVWSLEKSVSNKIGTLHTTYSTSSFSYQVWLTNHGLSITRSDAAARNIRWDQLVTW